jgi:hypothetical protein
VPVTTALREEAHDMNSGRRRGRSAAGAPLLILLVPIAAALAPAAVAAAAADTHVLSEKAIDLVRPLGIPITNSMLVSWIAAAMLLVFARAATRHMQRVPGPTQNLLEWLVASS